MSVQCEAGSVHWTAREISSTKQGVAGWTPGLGKEGEGSLLPLSTVHFALQLTFDFLVNKLRAGFVSVITHTHNITFVCVHYFAFISLH